MFRLFIKSYANCRNDFMWTLILKRNVHIYYGIYIFGIVDFVLFILYFFSNNIIYYYVAIALIVISLFHVILINKNQKSIENNKLYVEEYLGKMKSRIAIAKKESHIDDNTNNYLYGLIRNEYFNRKKNKHKINPLDGVEKIIVPAVTSILTSTATELEKYLNIFLILYCIYYIVNYFISILKIISLNSDIYYFELEELYYNFPFLVNMDNEEQIN